MAAVHMLNAMPNWGHTTVPAEKAFMETEWSARTWMSAAGQESKHAHSFPTASTQKAHTTVTAGKVFRTMGHTARI